MKLNSVDRLVERMLDLHRNPPKARGATRGLTAYG